VAPPYGLVSWWAAEGNTLDVVARNNGSQTVGVTYGTGRVGKAFGFIGPGDFVTMPANGLNVRTNDFTVLGWIRTTSVADTNVVMGLGGPAIYIRGSGSVQFAPHNPSANVSFNDGAFHHFAVVRQSGIVTYFKDGANVGTAAANTDLNPGGASIGSFPGLIDELAFFERALSASEVQSISAAAGDGLCQPARSYFIEAEDFDYDGGQHQADADVMPYYGGAYNGLSAVAEIDYHDPGGNENAVYRSSAQGVAMSGSADTYREQYSVTVSHKVGWNDVGDWFNYSRVFPAPARAYHIYARLSSGLAANAIQIDEVVSGAGTTNQTTAKIGEARGPATGYWDYFFSVPVLDANGQLATVNFSGQKTIRITILPGNEDINYLQFVPVDTVSNACVASPSGLVAWWPGDGHSLDLQGSNHGTNRNGATYTSGKAGESFVFDGLDDYVETAFDAQPSAMPNTTWECWVFPTVADGARRQILSTDDGNYDRSVGIESSTFIVFTGWGAWYVTGLSLNRWQHIAVVFATNNVEFYKDGVRFSYGYAPVGQDTTRRLNIGRNPGFGEYFQGRIDEVGIYNRALSAAEINAIYNTGAGGRCKPAPPCPALSITPASLAGGAAGAAYSQMFAGNGGAAPYVFSVANGSAALPPSLTLSSNGLLSGTLTATGTFPFTLRVTDNNGCSRAQNFSVTVTTRAPLCSNLPPNLVSWWRAEDNAEDSAGFNSAPNLNGTTFTAGKVGQAFKFDGVTNYLLVGTNGFLVGLNDFTIEGWVKTTSGKDYSSIFSVGSYNPGFYMRYNGALQLYPSTGTTNLNVNDGAFHHVAVVRQSGTLTYYKDGAVVGTASSGTPLSSPNVYIGTSTYGGENFPGLIDELSFYDRALSASEMQTLFAQGSAGKCGGGTNAPDIALSATNLSFASVLVGDSANATLTISNVGAGLLTVNSLATNNPAFTVVSPTTPFSIAAGTQALVTLRFAPTNSGSHTGTLTIASDDPDEGSVLVALSGTGSTNANEFINPVADYRFQNTLASSIGNPPDLQYINTGHGFLSTNVDGSARTVLGFPAGAGLSLAPTTGLLASNEFSVVMLMRFDTVPGYRRILDLRGATGDDGLYAQDGWLRYYGSGLTGPGPAVTGQWVQVVLTRNAANNVVAGYVNGVQQFSGGVAPDNVVIGANNSLRFFKDEAGEDSSGHVARIRLFNFALSSNQVVALDWFGGTNEVTGGTNCAPTPLDVVSWWAGENSPDDKQALNNGTWRNGPASYELARVGRGFNFAGISNYVEATMNDMTVGSGEYSVEGWIKATPGVPNTETIVSFGGSPFPGVYLQGNEGVLYLRNANSAPAGTGFKDGAFHHFAVVRQATNIAYYKDGANIGNVFNSSSVDLNLDRCYIGWDLNSSGFFPTVFNGVIDELTFYRRAITSNDVRAIFLAGSIGKCAATNPPAFEGPFLELSPTAPDFEYVAVGQSNELTLTISNPGTATLTISNIVSSNPRFAILSPATPFNVATAAQQSVTVRFTPAAVGLEVGSVAFSNNTAQGTFFVPVRGIGGTISRARAGTVFGWGDSGDGRIDPQMDTTVAFPLRLGALAGKTLTAISTIDDHGLALDAQGGIYAWGNGADGQLGNGTSPEYTNTPVAVQTNGALAGRKVIAIAAGYQHSVALTADGRVFAWGENSAGELGIGNQRDTNVPVAVKMDGALAGKRVTAISAGASFTLALASDGRIYGWGVNFYGQLGYGTNVTRTNVPVPVDMTGALAGKTVVAIAAGRLHALALTSDGKVFAWGSGNQGELGNGARTNSFVPVAVNTSGVLNGKTVVAISTDGPGGVALTTKGRVYTWGIDFYGALGTGVSNNISDVPVAVITSGALNGKTIVGIAASDIPMALSSDGQVFTWGDNDGGSASEGGALGAGLSYRALRQTNAPMAVDTSGFLARTFVSAIAAGNGFGLALAAPDSALVAPEIELILPRLDFGHVALGQTRELSVIISNSGNAALTVNVVSNTNPQFSLVSSSSFMVAPASAQAVTVQFAPTNHSAQFNVLHIVSNDADEPALLVPMNAVGAPTGTVALAWGRNIFGELGLSHTNSPVAQVTAVSTGGVLAGRLIVMVAGGGKSGFPAAAHSLALAADGTIYAWGDNSRGQLGNGSTVSSAAPVAVNMNGALAGKTIVAVAAGGAFSVALSADGEVFTWGDNNGGQLGVDSTNAFFTAPVAVAGALSGQRVIAIACGNDHAIALTANGKVFGWGDSSEGQVGAGDFEDRRSPVAVEGMLFNQTIVAIQAGNEFTLALDARGAVYAWGNDSGGGTPGIESGSIPIPFPAAIDAIGPLAGRRIAAVTAGGEHGVALTTGGELIAWGDNNYGQLGNLSSIDFTNGPMAVKMDGALAGKSIIALKGGGESTLALTSDGTVFSWGQNRDGQLGLGTNCPTYCGIGEPVALNTNSALAGKRVVGLGGGLAHHLAIAIPVGAVTNPVPDIEVTPTNVNFGTITVGTTNQLSLAITNVGGAALTVSSMNISNAATFSFIAASLPFSLNPGEGTIVAVQFRPASAGPHNGSLTIGSNDPDQPAVVIPLTGQGTSSSVPDIDVQPMALNFGTVAAGQTNTLSLVVSNAGTATLNVSSITVSNTAFRFTAQSVPFALVPGAATLVAVHFSSASTGAFTGTLTVGSNDPDEPSVVVPLNGTAGATAVPNLVAQPTSINFGSVLTGQVAQTTLVLSNSGNATLNVTSMTTNNPRFTIVSPLGAFALNAGATQQVVLRFSPATNRTELGQLRIVSNDPDGDLLIALSGEGTNIPAPPCAPVIAGLVSWWRAESNGQDYVGQNHGTPVNLGYAAGRVGQGFKFQGGSNYVEVPDSLSLRAAALTVDAWVKFDSLASIWGGRPHSDHLIIRKEWQRGGGLIFDSFALGKLRSDVSEGDRFFLTLAHSNGTATIVTEGVLPVATNQWYHVAASYDGTTAKLYLDGVRRYTFAWGQKLYYDSTPWRFGSSGEWDDGQFQGVLDEVGFYNRALSDAEVTALYNAGISGRCPENAPVYLGVERDFDVFLLTWPANRTGLRVETSTLLPPVTWVPLGNPVSIVAGRHVVVVTPSETLRFYRLAPAP